MADRDPDARAAEVVTPGLDESPETRHEPSDLHAGDHDGEAPGTHASTGHGAGAHGHAAAGEPLGPVDTRGWGAAIAGGMLGLVVVLALLVAIGS